MTDEYKIGYGKPPEHTRFQKGRSGNPKGRPKKKNATFFDIVDDVANKKIKVYERGHSKKVNLLEASLKKLFAEALKGDARALRLIVDIFTKQDKFGKNMIKFKEMGTVTYTRMGPVIIDGKELVFDVGEPVKDRDP